MNQIIRPLSEEFLYASPESVPKSCYRCGRKRGESSPLRPPRNSDRKRESKGI
jgi:hypothetical protein